MTERLNNMIPSLGTPRCNHQRGRWVVSRAGYREAYPWKVMLWGGNGEHWADGCEVATWAEAWAIAQRARKAYRWDEYSDHRYQAHFERRFMS